MAKWVVRCVLVVASIVALSPTLFLAGGAVHAPIPAVRQVVDNRNHLYVLDGWGGVHPVGSAPYLATTASWPHRDIAQSLALLPDGSGGYVMDGNGGIHAVGMNLPTGGTHFVTLTGLNGPGDYWTNDPWEQNAHHVTFSGDWVTRGPVYEAIAFI